MSEPVTGKRTAIYARYSSPRQHSIKDQIRCCREWAQREGLNVDEDLIFSDAAKSGRGTNRPGFQAMLKALREDRFDVLVVTSTNRTARRLYMALQFVTEEIVARGKRCVFVTQGIDTNHTQQWLMLMTLHGLSDELMVQNLPSFIHNAHIGLAKEGLVSGRLCYGYTAEVAPGPATRQMKPRTKIAINPEEAKIVRWMFEQHASGSTPMSEIARELRRRGVPPPQYTSTGWTVDGVRKVLENRRYIGDWSYGWYETVWGVASAPPRQIHRDAPRYLVSLEHLRIVDDDLFFRVEALRTRNARTSGGRKPPKEGRVQLLQQLLYCPRHDRPLTIIGGQGYYYCPTCREDPDNRELISYVEAQFGEEVLCNALATLIESDEQLVQAAMHDARRQLEASAEPDEGQIREEERHLKSVQARIEFILQNPGETELDRKENAIHLAHARRERATVEQLLRNLKKVETTKPEVPTVDRLRGQFRIWGAHLREVLISSDPDRRKDLKKLLNLFIGGRIVVAQKGGLSMHNGWLEGSFLLNLPRFGTRGDGPVTTCSTSREVRVSFRKPKAYEAISEEVKKLLDSGLTIKQICEQTTWSDGLVDRAIDYWYRTHGEPKPDLLIRARNLERPDRPQPPYRAVAQEAAKLFERQPVLSMADMAEVLKVDRATVKKAINYWHRTKGLAPADWPARVRQIKARTTKKVWAHRVKTNVAA